MFHLMTQPTAIPLKTIAIASQAKMRRRSLQWKYQRRHSSFGGPCRQSWPAHSAW
jgi:hypothetical protein